MIFLGPSKRFTPFSPSLIWTFISAVLLAFGHVLVFIPIFPDLIESIAMEYKTYPEDIVADISSSLYNGIYALGGLLGNLTAGYIVSIFQVSPTENALPEAATMMGLILIIFSAIYCYYGEALTILKSEF
jgi:hypothetical protein